MPFTQATAQKLINKLLRNTDFAHATNLYVSLHTADPGETGTSEVAGGSYARKAVTFNAPTGKATENSADVEFTGMPAVTVTHVGLWGATSAGTFWWGGALTVSKVVGAGDTFKLPAADIDVTLT